jgi:hypothetical protein
VILRTGTISLPATSWLVGSELTYRKRSLRLARLAWKNSLRQPARVHLSIPRSLFFAAWAATVSIPRTA